MGAVERLVLASLLVAACGPSEGMEGGHCYPNATCNVGLVCISNRCVVNPSMFDARVQTDAPAVDAATIDAPATIDASMPDATVIVTDDAAPPDAGVPDATVCSKQPCSITPQCGCTSGMACDLDDPAIDSTACRTAGAGDETTPCTLSSICAVGFTCFAGRCRRWCGGDGDCTAGPGALCDVAFTYGSPAMTVPGATICSTDCDPTATSPAGCPASWACHIEQESGGQMREQTDCTTAGNGGAATLCNGDVDCRAGFECVAVTRGSITQDECHPTCICPNANCAAGSCPAGTGSCQAYAPAIVIGTREYGVCI